MVAVAAAFSPAGAPGALAAAAGMIAGLLLEVGCLLRGLVPDPASLLLTVHRDHLIMSGR